MAEFKYNKEAYKNAITKIVSAKDGVSDVLSNLNGIELVTGENDVDDKYNEEVKKMKEIVPNIQSIIEKTEKILQSYKDSKEEREQANVEAFSEKTGKGGC